MFVDRDLVEFSVKGLAIESSSHGVCIVCVCIRKGVVAVVSYNYIVIYSVSYAWSGTCDYVHCVVSRHAVYWSTPISYIGRLRAQLAKIIPSRINHQLSVILRSSTTSRIYFDTRIEY